MTANNPSPNRQGSSFPANFSTWVSSGTATCAGALLALGCLLLATMPARADLLLRYSFDDTGATNTPAIDTGIPPEADGTFIRSATRTTNTPFASGFSLDTTVNDTDNDYVSAGNPTKLNGLTSFTMSFWINLQAAPAANDRLLSKISGTPAAGFELEFL